MVYITSLHMYIYIYIERYTFICLVICLWYIHVYIHIYIYIYIIYIHTYMCTSSCSWTSLVLSPLRHADLATKIIPSKIRWLPKLPGNPFETKIMLESNSLKSRILVRILAVICLAGKRATISFDDAWPWCPRKDDSKRLERLRPISLLTLSLLTLLDSNVPGNSLWAWEFHPLKSRLCSSQTLRNPQC